MFLSLRNDAVEALHSLTFNLSAQILTELILLTIDQRVQADLNMSQNSGDFVFACDRFFRTPGLKCFLVQIDLSLLMLRRWQRGSLCPGRAGITSCRIVGS